MNNFDRPSTGSNDPAYNGFVAAWEEVIRRLHRPINQFTFWAYLFLAVIGFGGLAIWVELWRYWQGMGANTHSSLDNLNLALATVFPAIVGASALQLLFVEERLVRALAMVFLAGHLLLALYLLGFGHPSDTTATWLGVAGCIGAILVWWIASGLDDNFQDRPTPDASVGGDPTRQLANRPSKIRT